MRFSFYLLLHRRWGDGRQRLGHTGNSASTQGFRVGTMKGGEPARVPCRALRLRDRGYGFRPSAVGKLDARTLVPRDRHADGLRRSGLGEARDR